MTVLYRYKILKEIHLVVIWLLFDIEYGFAQFCNPGLQNDDNTASFCTKSSTDGDIIFIISGAQRFEKVYSCVCNFSINGEPRNINISYSVANADESCSIKIKINGLDKFTCDSEDLSVSSLMSVEFSRSSTEDTNLCLEVSSDNPTNSTISVTCETESKGMDNTVTQTDDNETMDNTATETDDNETNGETTTTNTTRAQEQYTKKFNGSKKDNGALIGGIIGGSLTCIIIIIVVVFICLRKRKNKQPSRDGTPNELNPNTISKLDGTDNSIPDSKIDDDTVVTYNVAYNIEM